MCFLVTCAGIPQWEESVGGSGSHAQSAHWVPLPAHQLQPIQRSMGWCGMKHSRHTHSWTYVGGYTCVLHVHKYPWENDNRQLTPHLSQIAITQEANDLLIFYLKVFMCHSPAVMMGSFLCQSECGPSHGGRREDFRNPILVSECFLFLVCFKRRSPPKKNSQYL